MAKNYEQSDSLTQKFEYELNILNPNVYIIYICVYKYIYNAYCTEHISIHIHNAKENRKIN